MNNTNLVNKEKNTKRARVFSRIKKAVACVSAMVTTMMVEVNLALAGAGAGAGAGTTTTGTTTAEAKWDTIIGFIVPWITRLGGVVILIGAVEWGLAFKSDDAEGKTKGMRTIIAGCIVTAVGLSSDIFLA